jgi:hypothetical protein
MFHILLAQLLYLLFLIREVLENWASGNYPYTGF